MRNDFIVYLCKFCKKEITVEGFLPPDCSCEGFVGARHKWLEEYRSSPDYKEPLTTEEYNEQYPVTYFGERLIVEEDSAYKLKLEARKYGDREGLCVWVPFPDGEDHDHDSGLAWDFTDTAAPALQDLLGEYLERKNANNE